MTKIMTASKTDDNHMTDGQIETLIDSLRAAWRKHRREISKEAAQQALGVDNLGMLMFVAFRDIAQAMSGLIIHIVKVNRSHTPKEALDASGCKQYIDPKVVDTMPRGGGDEVELVYFKPDPSIYKTGRLFSHVALAAEYEKRGLVPDPLAQIDDNVANPTFADDMPNACQWRDVDGKYCCLMFDRWGSDRRVGVDCRNVGGWVTRWVFAGVRKKSSDI